MEHQDFVKRILIAATEAKTAGFNNTAKALLQLLNGVDKQKKSGRLGVHFAAHSEIHSGNV